MEKRLMLAIALAILIIVSFQYLFVKPAPQVAPPAPQAQTAAPTLSAPAIYEPPKNLPTEKELKIAADKYALTFSNLGGAIKEVVLNGYTELNSKEPLVLARISNPKEYIFNMSDLTGGKNFDTVEYSQKNDSSTITYSLISKEYEIIKRYNLPKSSNAIELQILVKNISSEPKDLCYSLIGGAGVSEKNIQDQRTIESRATIDGKKITLKRPRRGDRTLNIGLVGWESLHNKYFSVIIKPFSQTRGGFFAEDLDGNLITGIESEKVTLEPGARVEHKYNLYVGPSDIGALKQFGHGVEESIDYGIFGGISKLLIAALKYSHMVLRNWGLSIILLSVLLNVLLFPLTAKSFKSMQKMQELHPQMEKLKVQYKDSPEKLNKEIMELYRKYNINPLSGCLPVLLQMPIFIALYQALMKSIELRNAGFLWIRDLSSPEAIPLPLSFPIIGNSINLLPLIMVAAMVVQQKMSTRTMGGAVSEEQKQQQKVMLIVMPIMFGFIFYNMPSGLVLYWVVNTALTIVEQAVVLKKE